MNIEITDLDMILNHLETTSLEPHDDYTSEFSYKNQKLLWNYIKELREKNQKLKKQLEEYIKSDMKLKDELFNKRKEYQDTYKDVRIEIKEYKTQQKKFIKYLEDEKDRLIKGTSHYYIDSFDRQHAVNETIYDEVDIILQKYKEIIGVSNEKES